MDYTPLQIVNYFFGAEEVGDHPAKKRICMGCNIWYTGNKHGYSNLFSHITSKHVDYKVIMAGDLPPETSSLKRATDLYQWLYQIIINRLPINATKWSKIDKFTRFHVFNSRTITEYIYLLADYVAKKIKEDLKSVDMVNFVIDGWTTESHHIIGLFGYYEIDGIKNSHYYRCHRWK